MHRLEISVFWDVCLFAVRKSYKQAVWVYDITIYIFLPHTGKMFLDINVHKCKMNYAHLNNLCYILKYMVYTVWTYSTYNLLGRNIHGDNVNIYFLINQMYVWVTL